MNTNETKKQLESEGFTVLRTVSYRKAQERQRIAEALREAAKRDADSARAWARDCLDRERQARDRMEQIIAFAFEQGATYEDLRKFNERCEI